MYVCMYQRRPTACTQPPPSIVFGNTANLCDIFDAYHEHLERQRIAKERCVCVMYVCTWCVYAMYVCMYVCMYVHQY